MEVIWDGIIMPRALTPELEKSRCEKITKTLLLSPPRSQETINKARESRRGYRHSPETLQKMREARKNYKASNATKNKQSISLKGRTHSEVARKKLSEALMGHGFSEETLQKMRDAQKGEKSFRWKGGISFYPYCEKFTKRFRERVRAFFSYDCVECGIPQGTRKLHVHHVNFNKMSCCDNTTPLFVALCSHCHPKTNLNIKYWEKHFTDIINQNYGGKCYFTEEEMIALCGCPA